MMNNEEELEKTKPIDVLSELSRSTKYEEEKVTETREEKYQDTVEQEEQKEREEQAEEALAEKNIAMAEEILASEENKEPVIQELSDKKEGVFTKLKNKWNGLDKKKKILLIVILILIIVLVTVLILSMVLKKEKVEEKKPGNEQTKIEEAPVITDNFYYRDGKLYFTDKDEEVLGNYECENKDSNLCYVAFNTYRDSFDVPKLQDETGKEIVKRLSIYENRYAFIIDNKDENDKTIKLFSMTDGKLVGAYKTVKAYDNHYVIVEDEAGNYGLLQIEDGVKEIIKPQYKYLGMIEGQEYLIAKNNKGYVVVDKDNKSVSSTIPGNAEIKSYNKDAIVALINKEYNVYDYKASLIAGGYAFATVKDKYVALVDSEKNLTIRGLDKVKYNEGSISLDTNNYVKTYIYNKDGEVKKVKRSFELNIKSDKIEVAVYDNNDDVVYENVEFMYGLANKKYNYFNYFDGKLYFYKDVEKEELIGSVTCSNKNYIESESDTYNACYPARDTIYEQNDMMSLKDVDRKSSTMLINNHYVFINDGTNRVYLYDLIQNKRIGTYSSVNTYTPNNDYVFGIHSGGLEVVAVNTGGKYGVLSFDSTGVVAKYPFEYKGIQKIGKNYQLSEDGEDWLIKFEDGSESKTFSGKVMGYTSDYKYFKILNSSNKYVVYNKDLEQVGTSDYTYVELYKDYFASVDSDRKIHVVNYLGKDLVEANVEVGNYAFSRTDNPAFNIKGESGKLVANVYNGSTYEQHELTLLDKETEEE